MVNIIEIKELISDFDSKMILKKHVEDEIGVLEDQKKKIELNITAGKEARAFFQQIAQETQQNVEDHLSSIVTLALKSVDPEFPEFVVEMIIRRNQLECDLFFEKHGHRTTPLFSSGGGAKDVASFALFVAYWAMDKNRPTLILDEPFRNVSPDLQENVSEMVKMLSEQLNMQIIMVSHADGINICADKVFHVTLVDERSVISEDPNMQRDSKSGDRSDQQSNKHRSNDKDNNRKTRLVSRV